MEPLKITLLLMPKPTSLPKIDSEMFYHVNLFYLKSLLFPAEKTRVKLAPIEGIDGSDYINANFLSVNEFLFLKSLNVGTCQKYRKGLHRHSRTFTNNY